MSNSNQIRTDDFSNPESKARYTACFPGEPLLAQQYEDGGQCGGCSFFAPFNADYGLCANASSRHHLETVFEHFSCPALVTEGWGAHSFTDGPNVFADAATQREMEAETARRLERPPESS